MIESLVGNKSAEKVLLFLANYGEGYASDIADTFGTPLYSIQQQLKKFERAGVLVSLEKGKTRLFTWNPRYPLRKELEALLKKALSLIPESETKAFFRKRKRPRRSGKPQ
jgi:hypothetical protein